MEPVSADQLLEASDRARGDPLARLPLYDAAGSRAVDGAAIRDHGIDGYGLMTRAGEAAFRVLRARWPDARRLVVLCGAGNNGGDGYVVARLARAAGLDATVRWLVEPERLRGDAARAFAAWRAAGGATDAFDGPLPEADLLVDALLGTGLDRPAEGAFAEAIGAVNAHPAPVLAIDLPSGLHADTGTVGSVAIDATVTVTFITRKVGLTTGSGPAFAGTVVFEDLALPATIADAAGPVAFLATMDALRSLLRPRRRDAHKGDFGFVAVIGGAAGMPGAVRLAGSAALRAGAGMVKVGTAPEHAALVPIADPALMSTAVADAGAVDALLAWADVVALGPGLGRTGWSETLFHAALRHEGPLVLDADALNLLAAEPCTSDRWVLTPHPGEAARLLHTSTSEIQRDRLAAARAIQTDFGGVAVLKGCGTVVCDGGRAWVCGHGNPGMASAGMGDVLTGVVAALLTQGFAPAEAAILGVCVHAAAGDRAARGGERGLTAPDVLGALRAVVNPAP